DTLATISASRTCLSGSCNIHNEGFVVNGLSMPLPEPSQIFHLTTTVRPGQTTSLGMTLQLYAHVYAGPGESLIAGIDASHSVYWGGLTEFTVDGAQTPFTLSSASGTDYTQSFIPSVPVPAAFWLLLSGIGGLAVLGKVRVRRRGLVGPARFERATN